MVIAEKSQLVQKDKGQLRDHLSTLKITKISQNNYMYIEYIPGTVYQQQN